MVNWKQLITTNEDAVLNFAVGELSGHDFQRQFTGRANPARCAVRNYGTLYARRLARKALRRRGVKV